MKNKIINLSFVLITVISLIGCIDRSPSDELVKNSLYQNVNNFPLYREKFEIISWEKANGWQNEDSNKYTVSVNVKLKSKADWFEFISECLERYKHDITSNKMAEISYLNYSLQSQLQGMLQPAKDFYEIKNKENKLPISMIKIREELGENDFLTGYIACDKIYMDEYSHIIDRNLEKDSVIDLTYNLIFRKTEKGWMEFTS